MLKGTKSDDLYLPYMLLPTNGNVKKQLLEVIMYLLKCSKATYFKSYIPYMLFCTNFNVINLNGRYAQCTHFIVINRPESI
jgi:hypothetical protein